MVSAVNANEDYNVGYDAVIQRIGFLNPVLLGAECRREEASPTHLIPSWTIALSSCLSLRSVKTSARVAVPLRPRTVIDTGIRVYPDPDVGVARRSASSFAAPLSLRRFRYL